LNRAEILGVELLRALRRHGAGLEFGVVAFLGLGGWYVSDPLQQAAMVERIDPFERSDLDGIETYKAGCPLTRRRRLAKDWGRIIAFAIAFMIIGQVHMLTAASQGTARVEGTQIETPAHPINTSSSH